MPSKAPRINFELSFFTIGDHYELVEYDETNIKLKETWGAYYTYIKETIGNDVFSKLVIDDNKDIDHLHGKPIQILFLESTQLSGNALLNKLAETHLAKFRLAEFNTEKIETFAPMITIGTFDIMSLYAYPFEIEMNLEHESRMLRDLRLDTRYKFLDSSIWFRYIPVKPTFAPRDEKRNDSSKNSVNLAGEAPFFKHFRKLLEEICTYWIQGLYFTNAALATLELQLRLLQQSRLNDKIGQGGHAEAVTPFKFHSEGFLQNRTRNEIEFFNQKRGNNHADELVSLSSECKLRVLIVDDQAKQLSTIGGVGYKGKAVGKKDLILNPLRAVFVNMQEKDIVFSGKENGIVDFCLEKLKENSFDLIFLDYLLGKRKEGDSTREYGHEFLLNLLNDSKQEDFQYKRSFQGRFWIFSISSFPFALPDKLHQLGISHLQNLWHLSYGGDPVTTPHLYIYYLLRFIKQKVSVYFLHPELLLRILKENPVPVKKGNEKFWAEYLENTILNWQHRVDLASHHAQDDQSSLFTESIAWFCKRNVPLNKTLDIILKITALVKDGYVGGKAFFVYKQELETPDLKQFELVSSYLFKQINDFEQKYLEEQDDRVKVAIKLSNRKINFENLKMYELPQSLNKIDQILRELFLNNNQFTSLPKSLFKFKNLNRLNLSDNPLESIDGNIQDLPHLTDLNLTNTPFSLSLIRPHAKNREEVLNLWKEVMNLQKSNTIKKVLFFGLSPQEQKHLRIDKEFQRIKTALKGERFDLISNFAVDYFEFQREILRVSPKIVHFAGHGKKDKLSFELKSGFSQETDAKVIEDLFNKFYIRESIQCVILNACHTSDQAKSISNHGIYVVGMYGAIADDRAINFSEGFYNATNLIEQGHYERAFEMGLNAENVHNGKFRDTLDLNENDHYLYIRLWYNGELVHGREYSYLSPNN